MIKSLKNRILELLDTITEMVNLLCQVQDKKVFISDCYEAIESIMGHIEKEQTSPVKTLRLLDEIQDAFVLGLNNIEIINDSYVKELKKNVVLLKSVLREEVNEQLNVVFFPYKESMWDSLATIYEAAVNDSNCVAKVVPIPYYKLEHESVQPVYEGDLFPEDIQKVNYNNYDLETEQPDIIFVHNIYDQYNTITQVSEQYFTSNLKKYTDMLVYVPYHISSPVKAEKDDSRMSYKLPTIKNVDKVVLAGEFVEKEALRDGIPKEKILTLGSPKFDGMLKVLNEDTEFPDEWKDVIEGKTVFLLNTGCLYFVNDIRAAAVMLDLILDIPRYIDNVALIWRPHPLTEAAVKRYAPELSGLLESYYEAIKNKSPHVKNTILDQNESYFPALKVADVLLTNFSSILDSYLLTEKKVIYLGEKMPESSLIPSDTFYYFFDKDEPWFELAKKIAKGYDPLAKKRKEIASKFYECLDGTSGEKIYKAVKECVLRNQ
ncbi:MAG: CDP-glycerol glycerophosphotransferase family protein [Anaeromicrobium sp.]|jgi:hypothetical protein|uniref:hypothetical protein n=1 Tax=Anaeromicrobium sp. TaxID=1929132 RepID=UPI0025DBD7B7|nr:hypothetical protein [Anaeromicrobium sp.]MCT4592697.1 CDP-glycerol glycerophosphotransferase family protein [Anaeromicrobium sp.]